MEKGRRRREMEVTRMRRGGIKRGESNPASKQFPMCSPLSGTLREVHGVTQRKGRKEIKVRGRKRGIKRKEIDLGSTLFPKCSPQPGTHTEIHRVVQRGQGGGRR